MAKQLNKKNKSRLWHIDISLGDAPKNNGKYVSRNNVIKRLSRALENVLRDEDGYDDPQGLYFVSRTIKLAYDSQKGGVQ
jgi:hypothetical protein